MLHVIDVEFTLPLIGPAWCYPTVKIRRGDDADIAYAVHLRRPYTVVYDYDTEARP